VWVDESGFYLLPAVARTWAPAGETPILQHTLTNDHLSAISGITPEGKLYMMVQQRSINSVDVVRFLKHLLRHIPGKLLIIWDGSPIHRSKIIKTFLTTEDGKRVHLERLPGYAPETNPDEGIWRHLKYVELKNLGCHDLSELTAELRRAKERLRHKTDVIQACIRQPGYAL
jgi:transposase